MIDPVILLEHEEALVAFELLLDVLDVRSHYSLDIAFFRLELIGSLVERENEEVNGKA